MNNKRFCIYLEMKDGYKRTMELENTTETKLYVYESCRANVDRLAACLFSNNDKVESWEVWCESEE